VPGVLYLSGAGLTASPPDAGRHALPQSGKAVVLAIPVDVARSVQGRPSLVLFHQLQPRRGGGLPRASVLVTLQDCSGSSGIPTCRTLASTTSVLVRKRGGWSTQRVTLPEVRTTVAAGHTLRLVLALRAHRNVTAVLVGYGGTTPSRLLLP
jgi:hypothetical protein